MPASFTWKENRRLFQAAAKEGSKGVEAFESDLREGIEQHHIKPFVVQGNKLAPGPDYEAFRSNAMFENLVVDSHGEVCGRAFAENMRENRGGFLRESGGAVNMSAFSNIFGQLTYSSILPIYENPAYIGSQLCPTVQSTTQLMEMIPGVVKLGDSAQDVGEGEEYPRMGLTEDYLTVPQKVKDGFIVEMTEEAAWEDKTGLAMQMASSGADSMGYTREKELLDTALGLTTSYQRGAQNAEATYSASHAENFDNLVTSNALSDWTDIENVYLKFDAITQPNGEPLPMSSNMTVVVPMALKATAERIATASQVRHSGGSVETISNNPVGGFNVLTNTYVKNRTGSASTWFAGDFARAFAYYENWPLQTFVMGRESRAAFDKDILAAFKVRRKGAPAVVEPRYVVKCTS